MKITPLRCFSVLSLLLVTVAGPLAAEQPVSGVVSYDGPEIQRRAIRMGADPKCQEITEGQRVLAADKIVGEEGGLKNVFVYLETKPEGTPTPAPTEPEELRQHHCMYEPRVQGIIVDQELSIVNDDPTLHNVRCMAEENRPFNIGQPPSAGPRVKTFHTPEDAVKFKCDIHPWMEAFIFVMDHPFFAVTDEKGSYQIEGVPAGKHTLVFWHESFGVHKQEIEVADSPLTDVSTTYTGESE